ncbi:unnamed protein product [Adineta ricciae]|uniref:Tetratricopeptide repeat protein n=1 Tax=Adineta ricciae TaxID=249248 RepID=A0A814JIK2_ADIRI|nr:unnamed protein product [Adineta ricciae]CAF1037967.1 unnamed protein product [Adineta ricciae]
MNSFLSTILDRESALMFILGAIESEIVPVLFEINIPNDTRISTLYADVRNESYMQDEGEILFLMDYVFEIDSVSNDNENNQISVVKLIVTEQYEEKDGLKQLLDLMRMRINNTRSDTCAIAYLMQEMGYYDKARYYYELERKNLPPHHFLHSALYSDIAHIFDQQGNYAEALNYYQNSL